MGSVYVKVKDGFAQRNLKEEVQGDIFENYDGPQVKILSSFYQFVDQMIGHVVNATAHYHFLTINFA